MLPKAASLRSQFFTIWTNPKLVNKLFIFSNLSNEKKLTEKTHTSVTVTVVRDRKLWNALRTNRIVGFVTMPAWKKRQEKKEEKLTIHTCLSIRSFNQICINCSQAKLLHAFHTYCC